MPWTIKDVDKHKKGLTDKQKRQWVAIANSVRERCIKNGGDPNQCDVLAIKQANGVVQVSSQTYSVQINGYTVRSAVHQGVQHLIVPVVMMVEGVHNGSAGPVLHTREELQKCPQAWNGIPVTISHPKDPEDQRPMSANAPQVVDSIAVGRVYNATIEDQKLKGEVWLNEKKLKQLSPLAYGYIMQQLPLEVSVGAFTEDDYTENGDWNGEQYIAVAKNYRPDHLALLPGEKGACSWEDGCGIRLNSKGGDKVALKYSGTETAPWSGPSERDFGVKGLWRDLSTAEKARIASHFLIGSSAAADFSELKLPVVNPKTGKLNEHALRAVISGRGAQVKGVSSAQLSAARRKAYQLLNTKFGAKLKIPANLSTHGGDNMEKKVQELLAMPLSIYKDEDKEWLETLSEDQIDKLITCAKSARENAKQAEETKEKIKEMEAQINELNEKLEKEDDKDKDMQINEEKAMEILKEKISDMKTFSELLPEELKRQFNYGQKLYAAHRNELIQHIVTNQAEKVWDEESLKGLDEENLEKIAKAIKAPTDYSVAGAEFDEDAPKAYGEVLLPVGLEIKNEK